jgi:hypothetical protein
MGIQIPEAPPTKKGETQSPTPPENHFGGWWIVIILSIVLLIVAACFFLPACHLFFKKTPTETPPVETTQEEPYRKLDRALCDQFKLCDNDAQALRDFESDPEKIEQALSNLDTKDVWSFLLSFVDNSLGSPQAYLGELADFDKSNFDQIIDQQRKLRQGFVSFQDVTQLSFNTPPNSEEYPVLSFVYQVSHKFPEMPEQTTLEEENKLPFFRNNDVARAKFLDGVIEVGRYNKLIDDGKKVKVFDALCQLTDEKTVDAVSDQEDRIKKLCIVPDKEYPAQQQCERLDTEDKKKQAKAFLELREKLKTQLGCDA